MSDDYHGDLAEKKTPWHTSPEWWERLHPLARQHRRESTPAEAALWQRLRRNQIDGAHFRRQHPVERFIVDFYCGAARLIVEVDGEIHDYTPVQDAIRQEYLESLGFRVLRFTNEEVLDGLNAVIEQIRAAVNA